jgi:transposase InsO family protein
MDLGGRGDCIAMDFVGGKDSLPITPRGNKYILTIIDCFTRYALAIALPDQSSSCLINTVLSHYITLFGVPRCILTD